MCIILSPRTYQRLLSWLSNVLWLRSFKRYLLPTVCCGQRRADSSSQHCCVDIDGGILVCSLTIGHHAAYSYIISTPQVQIKFVFFCKASLDLHLSSQKYLPPSECPKHISYNSSIIFLFLVYSKIFITFFSSVYIHTHTHISSTTLWISTIGPLNQSLRGIRNYKSLMVHMWSQGHLY